MVTLAIACPTNTSRISKGQWADNMKASGLEHLLSKDVIWRIYQNVYLLGVLPPNDLHLVVLADRKRAHLWRGNGHAASVSTLAQLPILTHAPPAPRLNSFA